MAGFARWLQPVFAFGITLFANEHQRKPPFLLAIFLRPFVAVVV
jgi:hypothetical protein